MYKLVSKFLKDESGATAIEYALIAGLISVAVIGTLTTASGSIITIWGAISTALSTAAAGAGG